MTTVPSPRCRLCLRRKKLIYSHIMPEFLYLQTYDHKHRAIKVSSNSKKGSYIQKGEREYLLCEQCEGKFGNYENYAAPIIKTLPSLPPDSSGLFLLTPIVDYSSFKLFQLSLLWRASVSTNPMFGSVKLGKQEERLRSMLLQDRPGKPHQFGCMMIILQNTTYLKRIIWSPVNPKTKTPRLAFGKLLLNESRLALRVPIGLVAGLGLPILLLVILGLIPGTREPSSDLGGLSYFALLYPILVAVTILSQSINMLPRNLIKYRETGILRRLSVTPVPPSWLLAAQIVINLAIAVIGIILLTAVGVAVFDLEPPRDIPGFLLADFLTITSLFSIGLFIAAVVQNDAMAQGIGGILFFALLFFGGLWIPRPLLPPVLIDISNWIPLGASVAVMQNAMQGTALSLQPLLVLIGYTVILGYLSVRLFQWE